MKLPDNFGGPAAEIDRSVFEFFFFFAGHFKWFFHESHTYRVTIDLVLVTIPDNFGGPAAEIDRSVFEFFFFFAGPGLFFFLVFFFFLVLV